MPIGVPKSGKRICSRRTEYVVITCEQCGGNREYPPGEIRRRGAIRFCSNECKGKGQIRDGWKIEVACAFCGVAALKRSDHLSARKSPCCSKTCASALRRDPGARWRDPEQIKAYMAEYSAANRGAINAGQQRWKKANRERVQAQQRARRALTGYLPLKNQFWNELKAKYDHCCLACGRREPEVRLEKDHVVPVKSGGTNDPGNFQPLCRPCNARKGNRTIDYRLMWAVHRIRVRET